jgi:hypothetical protein
MHHSASYNYTKKMKNASCNISYYWFIQGCFQLRIQGLPKGMPATYSHRIKIDEGLAVFFPKMKHETVEKIRGKDINFTMYATCSYVYTPLQRPSPAKQPMTFRITGVPYFVHHPGLKYWNTTNRKLEGEGGGRCLLCWVPQKELTSITGQPPSYN